MRVQFQEQYSAKSIGMRLGLGLDTQIMDDEDFKNFLVHKEYEKYIQSNARNAGATTDFIKQGKDVGTYMYERQLRQRRACMLREGLLKSAKEEKSKIDEENHKYKYFQLHKWNILKQIKHDMQIQAEETKRQRLRATTWVKYNLAFNVLQDVFNRFTTYKEEKAHQELMNNNASMIQRNFARAFVARRATERLQTRMKKADRVKDPLRDAMLMRFVKLTINSGTMTQQELQVERA